MKQTWAFYYSIKQWAQRNLWPSNSSLHTWQVNRWPGSSEGDGGSSSSTPGLGLSNSSGPKSPFRRAPRYFWRSSSVIWFPVSMKAAKVSGLWSLHTSFHTLRWEVWQYLNNTVLSRDGDFSLKLPSQVLQSHSRNVAGRWCRGPTVFVRSSWEWRGEEKQSGSYQGGTHLVIAGPPDQGQARDPQK